ncbi:4-amino-4-deoxy-L-arabinose transferase-like glycosyltransferase [Fontibacillus solani]|uniref:4-amino-4-deoxy-L-arabinose transferase-like glycosyltransferase n=1 Tax=Fontibacillus solani TaxID=1572857 RepID=A0A7W3SVP8_9BACL|nr:glycosyltransferase family 39 protein [Fontibacillus solani]MBA9087054.1 4-amino-4-deoxy-L-arabinose transferase-like glycosyltransferase [Fontibacillus solani]
MKKWIYVVLAVALALRVYYIVTTTFPPLVGDAFGYDKMAKQFLETGVLGYLESTPNSFVMPGFPVLLSMVYLVFGTNLIWFQLLQVIFSVSTIAVIYKIAQKFMKEIYCILTAAMMAIYPSFIYANGLLLTEVSFTLLVALFLWLLWLGVESGRKVHFVLSGVCLGLSVMFRPTLSTLIVPIIVYFIMQVPSRKRIWQAILYVGLSSFVIVMPWWIRNFLLYDKLVLFTSSSGNPMLWGVHPYLIGVLDTFEAIYKLNADELTRNGLWSAMAKEMFADQMHNGLFIKWFIFGKLNYFWRLPWIENGEIAHLLEKLRNPLHLILVIGGWMGIWLSVFRRSPLQWVAVFMISYTILHQVMLAIPRYAFPVMPYVILMFVYLLSSTEDLLSRRFDR